MSSTPTPRAVVWTWDCSRCHETFSTEHEPPPSKLCGRCEEHVREIDKEAKARAATEEPEATPRVWRRREPVYHLPPRRAIPAPTARPAAPPPADLDGPFPAAALERAVEEVAAEIERESEDLEEQVDVETKEVPAPAPSPAPAAPSPRPERPTHCRRCKNPLEPRSEAEPNKLEGVGDLCRACWHIGNAHGAAALEIPPDAPCKRCGGPRTPDVRNRMPPPEKCWKCTGTEARNRRPDLKVGGVSVAKAAEVYQRKKGPTWTCPCGFKHDWPPSIVRHQGVCATYKAGKNGSHPVPAPAKPLLATPEPKPAPAIASSISEAAKLHAGAVLDSVKAPDPTKRLPTFPPAIAEAIVELGHRADGHRAQLQELQNTIASLERIGNEIARAAAVRAAAGAA